MEMQDAAPSCDAPATSWSIAWYSVGQSRVVEIDGIPVTIRYVGRKGRRGRIVIEAPPGSVFWNDARQ
jgi:hypothetical protein